MDITLKQAKRLVESFGDDDDDAAVLSLVEGDDEFHSGPGLYVRDQYDEHGCVFLGEA